MNSLLDNIHYEEKTGNVMVSKIGKGIEFLNRNDGLRAGKDMSDVTIAGGAAELIYKDGMFVEIKDLVM